MHLKFNKNQSLIYQVDDNIAIKSIFVNNNNNYLIE